MTAKFKTIGLTGVAVALMLAITGSAQAAQFHATAPGSVSVTGQQTTQFKVQLTAPNGPSISCAEVLFEATTSQTSQDITMTPTFTTCTALGQTATIKANGCKLTATGEGQPARTTLVDVAGCTSGQQIEIQTSICQIKIPEQTGISHTTATDNATPPGDIDVTMTMTGIKYQFSGAVCGHTTNVQTADGSVSGAATFRAFNDAGTHQATLQGHQYSKLTHGSQVPLTST
jgi:hypothetical protein